MSGHLCGACRSGTYDPERGGCSNPWCDLWDKTTEPDKPTQGEP